MFIANWYVKKTMINKMGSYLPVSVAMAGCSQGGTVSGRARALYSSPAHSTRPPSPATLAIVTSCPIFIFYDPIGLKALIFLFALPVMRACVRVPTVSFYYFVYFIVIFM